MILALSEVVTQVCGAVIVAAITASGAVMAARAARHDVARRVGEPNGHGNLIEMVEELLNGQARHDTRFARLEERTARMEDRQADHHERLIRVEEATVTD